VILGVCQVCFAEFGEHGDGEDDVLFDTGRADLEDFR